MEFDSKELKLGRNWFMIVLPVAVLLVITLASVDRMVQDPTRRNKAADVIREVRQAQYGLVSNTDNRIEIKDSKKIIKTETSHSNHH